MTSSSSNEHDDKIFASFYRAFRVFITDGSLTTICSQPETATTHPSLVKRNLDDREEKLSGFNGVELRELESKYRLFSDSEK